MALTPLVKDFISNYITEALVPLVNEMNEGSVDIDTSNRFITPEGDFAKVRNLNDISGITERQVTSATNMDDNKYAFSDYLDTAVIVHRGLDPLPTNEIEKLRTGMNPIDEVRSQVPEMVARKIQTTFVNVINGVFATALAANDEDYSTEGDGLISDKALTDLPILTMGENASKINRIRVHSYVYNDMLNQKLVKFVPGSALGDEIARTGVIPTYLGKIISINDTLCAAVGGLYPTYLMGGKPLYLGWQRAMRFDEKHDAAVGGGQDLLYIYYDYCCHIKGVKWNQTTANPTNAQLATAAYWTLVADANRINIMRVWTKAETGS